jgi:hypothetical protein
VSDEEQQEARPIVLPGDELRALSDGLERQAGRDVLEDRPAGGGS